MAQTSNWAHFPIIPHSSGTKWTSELWEMCQVQCLNLYRHRERSETNRWIYTCVCVCVCRCFYSWRASVWVLLLEPSPRCAAETLHTHTQACWVGCMLVTTPGSRPPTPFTPDHISTKHLSLYILLSLIFISLSLSEFCMSLFSRHVLVCNTENLSNHSWREHRPVYFPSNPRRH